MAPSHREVSSQVSSLHDCTTADEGSHDVRSDLKEAAAASSPGTRRRARASAHGFARVRTGWVALPCGHSPRAHSPRAHSPRAHSPSAHSPSAFIEALSLTHLHRRIFVIFVKRTFMKHTFMKDISSKDIPSKDPNAVHRRIRMLTARANFCTSSMKQHAPTAVSAPRTPSSLCSLCVRSLSLSGSACPHPKRPNGVA